MFWAEFDENDWRIFLATPLPDRERPEDPYRQVSDVLYASPEVKAMLDLSDIVIVRPEARVVYEMERRYGHVVGDRRVVRRLSLSSSEAYVYELRPNEQEVLAGATA